MKALAINKFFLAPVILLGVLGCNEDQLEEEWLKANPEPTVEVETGTAGTLDLSNYISVGNSLTAGFADGALFPRGQENSFPAILANRFAVAGGGEFVNPNIVTAPDGTGRIAIDLGIAATFLATGEGSLSDALITASGAAPTANTETSFNNYGVPGARVIDIVTMGYGNANPFFGAFQSSGTASVVADAAAANPSFFSLWIGNNDVLGYTLDGGQNDVFDAMDPSTITDAGTFSSALSGALDALSAGGADGVILTIPPVTSIPYMQIATQLGGGVELIPLTDNTQIAQLNGAFNFPIGTALTDGNDATNPGYNSLLAEAVTEGSLTQAEADRRNISWSLGANAPMITDESLTPVTVDLSEYVGAPGGTVLVDVPLYRQASNSNPLAGLGDLFPLPALFTLGTVNSPTEIVGITAALGDEFTLTETEQLTAITAVATFNTIIRGQAAARANVTLVDLDPLFADVNGLSAGQATAIQMSQAGIDAADGVQGRVVDGFNLVPISLDTETVFNSLFSTDFVHPNSKGAALIANEIIVVLNAEYGATIPQASVLEYPGLNAILP